MLICGARLHLFLFGLLMTCGGTCTAIVTEQYQQCGIMVAHSFHTGCVFFQVAIVDTNNPAELPDDLEPNQITSVVDHHKLCGLNTEGPIEVRVTVAGAVSLHPQWLSTSSSLVRFDFVHDTPCGKLHHLGRHSSACLLYTSPSPRDRG